MKDERYIRYGLFTSILVALGPVLWLFINIYDKNYENIVLNVVFVILGLTLVVYNIRNYLKVYNKKYSASVDILRHIVSFIFYILLIAVLVVSFIAFYIGIAFIQRKLFVKGEYLIYFIKSPYSYLLFVILAIAAITIRMLFSRKEKEYSRNQGSELWGRVNKFLILIIIPLIYIVITSVVVVTEDGIYDYNFYNLKGNKYNFSDVEYVNTGFVDRGKNKGEFFYNIQLKNSKKIKLAHPSLTQPSDKYENESWQEYVDIDKYIMDSGAEKTSSENGSRYVQMDKRYVDKLLYVVRNKNK